MKTHFTFLISLISTFCSGQQLAEPVTNNAVAVLRQGKHTMIYSFFGLDSTKKWSGVHNKVIRYNLQSGESSVVLRMPDLGRLAAGASVISNKAYVVGGYAVFENGKEKSSNQLFIFNPRDESVQLGASLPVPIDDHVQATWRNQLLYVLGGWSDSVNVTTVQLYNPVADRWQMATPLPDELGAKVFGGCGTIVGDTIYFLGGATFSKFYPPSRNFYKGVINPRSPDKVKWISAGEYPGNFRYRSAAFSRDHFIYFIGGSNETYNYNGISYAEKKLVEPNRTILIYDQLTGRFSLKDLPTRMDLRSVAVVEPNRILLAGGMGEGQKVESTVVEINIP
jgi:N-acetylneuraminic acid mutarotase